MTNNSRFHPCLVCKVPVHHKTGMCKPCRDALKLAKKLKALRNMPCTCAEANPLSGIMVDEVCPRCKKLDELSEEIADE